MYKLLIIDDEYLVREGLKMTIDWASFSVEIVGEAANGAQGLEMAEQLNPDLIISDVRMPVLTGVELAIKLREHHFPGKIIILSGYRDFEYAKSSFENGVVAYVLKPVDNDELIAAVKGAIRQIEQDNTHQALLSELTEQMPVVKRQFIRDLLAGGLSLDDIKKKTALFSLSISSSGTLIDVRADDETGADFSFTLLQKALLDHCKSSQSSIVIVDNRLLVFTDQNDLKKVADQVRAALEEYERKEDDTISVALAAYSDFSILPTKYQKCEELLKGKLMIGLNTITLENSPIGRFKKTVTDALAYISKHYAEEVTVKLVADELQVSESHLMHQFKDETDKTFNEILTDYRMAIARKLLRNGSYRVNEVSYLVGYRDVKYFSLIFSRRFGVLPSIYMERYK